MSYKILIGKPARKFIEKQPANQQKRILKAIAGLPDSGDIKPKHHISVCVSVTIA